MNSKHFYVAPESSNDAKGTFEDPFDGLLAARNAVRRFKKENPETDITVNLLNGQYNLSETLKFGLEDSGTRKQRITWQAYEDAAPIITGIQHVREWKKTVDYPEGLPVVSKGYIWEADVGKAVISGNGFKTLYKGTRRLERSQGKGFQPENEEIFILNGMYNKFWEMTFSSNEEKSRFPIPEGALKNWKNIDDIELFLYPSVGYSFNILPVKLVDLDRNFVETTVPATYPVKKYTRHWLKGDAKNESVWPENVPEGLDRPGRWMLNSHEGKLYYWPEDDKPGNDILFPVLTEYILIEGKNDEWGDDDVPVEYLTFRGLSFMYGERDTWKIGDASIQHDWEMYDKATAMLRFRGSRFCRVEKCHFAHAGGTALRMDCYSQFNTVEKCLFEDLGHTGIFISGYAPGLKDVSKHNKIKNNRITGCGRIFLHGHGIIVNQSGHNLIANNYVHDVPRKGICITGVRTYHFDPTTRETRECSKNIRWDEIEHTVEWRDMDRSDAWFKLIRYYHTRYNTIENNELVNNCNNGADGSGINLTAIGYGHIVRNNYLHDFINPGSCSAIRVDEIAGGVHIYNNIIRDTVIAGLCIGDNDHRVENNIFINTGNTPGSQRATAMLLLKGKDTEIKNNIMILHPDRKNCYFPDLNGDISDYICQNNLIWIDGEAGKSTELLLNNQQNHGVDLNSLAAEPEFVDIENGIYQVKESSPALKLGFKNVDQYNIGLLNNYPVRFRYGSKR